MKESLPPQLLKEKLPRFLQKCSQTFQSDRRYSNDLRYLRVWLQLMDFVDDPKAVLQTMEVNRIGMKKSLFYQAYALYYEKMKKFEAAEKMYHLGVRNLAEPTSELQNSFEQFIRRMERHKNRKIQRQGMMVNRSLKDGKIPLNYDESEENAENISKAKEQHNGNSLKESLGSTQYEVLNDQNKHAYSQNSENQIPIKKAVMGEVSSNSYEGRGKMAGFGCKSNSEETEMELNGCRKSSNDETVVVRFVDTAIIGKSAAEDARHHGLVEPTINTKEAMNAINSMFREPIEPSLACMRSRNQLKTDQKLNSGLEVFVDDTSDHEADTAITGKFAAEDARHHGLVEPTINTKEVMNAINSMFREPLETSLAGRRSRNEMKTDQNLNCRFEVFVDENSDHKVESSHQNMEKHPSAVRISLSESAQSSHQQFQIYIDDEENNEAEEIFTRKDELVQGEVQDSLEGAHSSSGRSHSFVFQIPNDPPSEDSEDADAIKPPQARFREDTVVYRFARSTISDEPEVENVCHHGLVEPTINMKEAMDDINSMFGKPIEFVRKRRPRKQDKLPACKSNTDGFLILPDDGSYCQQGSSLPSSSTKRGNDLFEQTICTKEAMDEINNMFKMPLDF